MVTLTLTVNRSNTGTDEQTACDSYDWNGQTYTESGIYEQTLTNASGCDSVVTLTLTVNPSYELTDSHELCQGETYEWQGHTYGTEAGEFTVMETLQTVNGCDSVVTMTVTVNPLPEVTITNKEQTITYGDYIATVTIENENSILSYTLPSALFSASTVDGNVEINTVGLLSVGTYKIPVEVNSDQTPNCGTLYDTIKVTVNPRPLIIKLIASKHYDGTIMEFDQTVFDGVYPDGVTVTEAEVVNLATGDYLYSGHIETEDSEQGVYTCFQGFFGYVMDRAATQTGFVVKNGNEENMNSNYIPQFQITLTITEPAVTIICEAQSVMLKDCEGYYNIAMLEAPELEYAEGVDPNQFTVTPSLANGGTTIGLGENTVIWTVTDNVSGAELATCQQTVTVNYPPCLPVEYQGHTYPAVRIGSQCWLAENLRNEEDADGNPIANFRAINDDESMVEGYGYLYSWYSAVGVEEGVNDAMPTTYTDECENEYVRGICPENWGIPSQADVTALRVAVEDDASLLKDFNPQYWLPGANGTYPNTNFNAHASGHYNSAAGQFEGRLLYAYFWESDSQPGASEVISVVISYYCSTPFEIISSKEDLRPVRCVRKVTPGM